MKEDKSLKNRAIDIKGKKYVLVSDRVLYFNENYPNWSIQTSRESVDWMEIVKAFVVPNIDQPTRMFTGYSQAKWGDGFINKTSALENAETSAVGRALAMMWIWVIDSIASVDEINKAENTAKAQKPLSPFQRALSNTKFMRECLDEDDFIAQVGKHIELDEIKEWQLRRAYQEAATQETSDTLF